MDDAAVLDAVMRRAELLRRLCSGAADKRTLVEDLDDSRSTVDRGVRELASLDLIGRRDGEYAATAAGRLAVDHLDRFRREFRDVAAAERVLAPLPPSAPVSPATVAGGDAVLATEPDPYRPLERLHEALAAADHPRLLLPSLPDPRHVRLLYEHVVVEEAPAEVVLTPELFRALRGEFPRQAAAMAESGRLRAFVAEDLPPFAVERAGPNDDTVATVVFGEAGGVHGVVTNETPAARRWAEECLAAARQGATDWTDALTPDADGGLAVGESDGSSPLGRALPVSLERAGFVHLDATYFREEPTADPATAWRAGLSIPEVHTGYAVERAPPDGVEGGDAAPSMTAALLGALSAGEDRVVVGPPASGKSTVCKRVACEWYERDLGPVYYREHGRGRAFESVADLVHAAEAADGHALVVVEDAVRPGAAPVFEAVERLRDREDVSVLLDARESEWRDPPGEVADVDLRTVRMPRLDEAAVERLVRRFERTVGEPVDVPAQRLYEAVRAESEDGPGGGLLLLLHRLGTYADPLAEERTTLEAEAAALYDDLDDVGRSVCLLASALNAAGLGVPRGALYAVADPDAFDAVDAARRRLEGRLLFPRTGGRYRTVHESCSVTLLEEALTAEDDAPERFGRAVTRLLALADAPERRERIAAHLDDPTALAAVGDDPASWAAETVRAVHALGLERPKLAPLFGDGTADGDTVDLPAAVPSAVRECRPARLGRGFLAGGYYDRAERAFRRLPAPDAGGDLAAERLLGRSRVATERGEYDAAVEYARRCLSVVASTDSSEAGDCDEDAEPDESDHDRDGDVGTDDRDAAANDPDAGADAPDRDRAALALGRALKERGDYEAAVDRLEAALSGFEARNDRRRAATALSLLGAAAKERGALADAAARHRRSLARSRALGDRRGVAESLSDLGSVAFSRGEYDRARDRFERSLELRRAVGDRSGEVACLRQIGVVAHYTGEHDRARSYYREALALARDIGARTKEAAALGNLGLLDERRGNYERARERLERSIEMVEDGSRITLATRLNNLGLVCVRQADHERSRAAFDRARRIAAEHDLRRQAANGLSGLGHVARMRGRHERAREYHERALSIVREMGHPRREADGLNKLGLVAARRGDLDRAREHLRAGLSLAREIDHPHEAAIGLFGLAHVARMAGAYDRARSRLADARALTDDIGDRLVLAQVRLSAARLALDRADPERARERGERARETFEELGARQWAARARRLLGRVAATADETTTAREHLTAALETFGAVEAPQDALATLESLTTVDDDPAWRDRVAEVAREAPEGALDRHRDLVDRHAGLDSD